MRKIVKFYKDGGDGMSIQTNIMDEHEFVREAASVLSAMVEEEKYKNDWDFQLSIWLPQLVEIACKLRGYKSDVQVTQWISAGGHEPDDRHVVGQTYFADPEAALRRARNDGAAEPTSDMVANAGF
jgi:hypothetical protein